MWCIDPTGCSGVPADTWSPVTGCHEWPRASRVASDLCEAAKSDGTTADGEFWNATAAKLLAPLLLAAALDGRTMADVVRWVDTQEVDEVAGILEDGAAPTAALDAARATWCRDERTRSSVYTTAETVLAPFAQPLPAPSSAAPFEPRLLLDGPHTLYLCAPAHDQRRLRGYFTALTQQVLGHTFARATRSGPLRPPLLVVLDEAAHIAPLPELDGLAATCASHGIQIVTVWQDLAQVKGPLRGSGAHGAEQPSGQALPARDRRPRHARVRQPAHRRRGGLPALGHPGPHGAPIDHVDDRHPPAAAPEELRCLPRGRAVLVYGTLPPARLRLRPWWARRARRPWVREAG